MIKRINIGEVATKLAEREVKERFKNAIKKSFNMEPNQEEVDNLIYKEDENGDIVYTEEAQEIFNNWYDFYEDLLLQSKE